MLNQGTLESALHGNLPEQINNNVAICICVVAFSFFISILAQVIAMTCTFAALKRTELVRLKFEYDNILPWFQFSSDGQCFRFECKPMLSLHCISWAAAVERRPNILTGTNRR